MNTHDTRCHECCAGVDWEDARECVACGRSICVDCLSKASDVRETGLDFCPPCASATLYLFKGLAAKLEKA